MLALLGIALFGMASFAAARLAAATGEAEEELPPDIPPEEEAEVTEVIDAEYREGLVYWAALADWKSVFTRWPNEWPADTDITLSWEIRNTGNVGAYFQVYLFTPGDWLYVGPNERIQVLEEFHTPSLPVTPGYQYYHINILGRKITGERIGAVWSSEEIEVTYV